MLPDEAADVGQPEAILGRRHGQTGRPGRVAEAQDLSLGRVEGVAGRGSGNSGSIGSGGGASAGGSRGKK